MVGSLQALHPLRLIPADQKFPINRLTILFSLAIAGLALYTIYSLRQRATCKTPKATSPFDEGNTAFEKKNLPLALSHYTAALAQATEPNEQAKISIQCSQAYSKLRQFSQAMECCKAALRDDLDSMQKELLLLEMGTVYEMQENLPEALSHYNQAQACKDSSNTYINVVGQILMSQVHRKSRDFSAALKCCENALSNPADSAFFDIVHLSRSWTLLDQGNIEEAEKENNIALGNVTPDQVNLKAKILILQTDILNRKGQPQQALEVGNQAVKLSPRSDLKIEIHLGRALSHYKFNKSLPLDECLQNYSDALDLVTNESVLRAFILYNKSIVHVKLKQMHSTQECLEKASKCDYKNEPFGRDLLRFMLEPLKEEEETFSPAQILERRILQKQQELQALVAQEDE